MKNIREAMKVLRTNYSWNDKLNICKKNLVASISLCVAATIMLILNIMNDSVVMTHCSIILVVGFFVSAVFAGILKNAVISKMIIGALVCFVLSVFAISGGNEGFAILWILLVPILAVGLLDVEVGLIISTYFLLFLIALFYSPLNYVIEGKYTDAFCSRFPVLFACDYVMSLYLSLQREYYYRTMRNHSYLDELTQVFNRRYFIEHMSVVKYEEVANIAVLVFDLNGLKLVNDTYGHSAGDELITGFADCCKQVFENDAIISRMGGDEYAVLIEVEDSAIAGRVEALKQKAKAWKGEYQSELSFSVGWASKNSSEASDMDELYRIADEKMYENKRMHYQNKANDRRKNR